MTIPIEKLKENILNAEEKKQIWSNKFEELKNIIKQVLNLQDSGKAIEYITS